MAEYEIPGPVEDNWKDAISSVEEIIEDARNGRMFILVDHEDRENEGDLVIPAQWATPDAVNFMAMYGRGLICLAMPAKRIEQLGLGLIDCGADVLDPGEHRGQGQEPGIRHRRQQPRQGRLAGSPWPTEQVGMRDALAADGVRQRLADMILTNDIAEPLRTVFAGYDLVRHQRQPNRSTRPRKAQCAWPSAWH